MRKQPKRKPTAIFSKRKYNKWFKRSMKRNKIPTRLRNRGKSPREFEWLNQGFITEKFKKSQKTEAEILAWYGFEEAV